MHHPCSSYNWPLATLRVQKWIHHSLKRNISGYHFDLQIWYVANSLEECVGELFVGCPLLNANSSPHHKNKVRVEAELNIESPCVKNHTGLPYCIPNTSPYFQAGVLGSIATFACMESALLSGTWPTLLHTCCHGVWFVKLCLFVLEIALSDFACISETAPKHDTKTGGTFFFGLPRSSHSENFYLVRDPYCLQRYTYEKHTVHTCLYIYVIYCNLLMARHSKGHHTHTKCTLITSKNQYMCGAAWVRNSVQVKHKACSQISFVIWRPVHESKCIHPLLHPHETSKYLAFN